MPVNQFGNETSFPVRWAEDWGDKLGGQIRQALEARRANQLAEQERLRLVEERAHERARQDAADAWQEKKHEIDVEDAKIAARNAKQDQAKFALDVNARREKAAIDRGATWNAANPQGAKDLAQYASTPESSDQYASAPPDSFASAPSAVALQAVPGIEPGDAPIEAARNVNPSLMARGIEAYKLREAAKVAAARTAQITSDERAKKSVQDEFKSDWGTAFTGPDGFSYQQNVSTGATRHTPGVGRKADNQPEPSNFEPDVRTSPSGQKYIDASQYTGAERTAAQKWARAHDVKHVGKEAAGALEDIDVALSNNADMFDQIRAKLPKDAAGRALGGAAKNTLESFLQSDADKAAFGSWRTAAIRNLRATAGSKGLRLNSAEINLAVENDIPKITDTYAVAQQKLANVETMLRNGERAVLGLPQTKAASKGPKVAPGGFTIEKVE
jgi:hypothetical protein